MVPGGLKPDFLAVAGVAAGVLTGRLGAFNPLCLGVAGTRTGGDSLTGS